MDNQEPDYDEIYPKRDRAHDAIELPEEPAYSRAGSIASMHVGDVPRHIVGRLKEAHFRGHLGQTLSHWTSALDGAGIVDKQTIKNLKELRSEIRGQYGPDQQVLDKAKAILSELKVGRR